MQSPTAIKVPFVAASQDSHISGPRRASAPPSAVAPLSGGSGRLFRACEALALPWVAALEVLLAFRLIQVARGSGGGTLASALAAVGVALGFAAADLLSGVVHWAFDRWGSVETPLLGRSVIRTFREHHEDPHAITRHDLVETNGTNALSALPLLALGFVGSSPTWQPLIVAFAATTGGLVAATGQIHKWAHSAKVPSIVSALQRAGILLGAHHHAKHHEAPYTSHYCITTGWWNPILERTSALRTLERITERAVGRRSFLRS